MKFAGSEGKFRLYFRGLLHKNGVWTAAVEHRSGGSVGVGDLLVQCREELIPVELKVADIDPATGILHSSRIRPAQIRLMDEALAAGIRARLLLGVPNKQYGWWVYMLRDVRRERLMAWRKGFSRRNLELLVSGGELLIPVEQW